MSTRTPLGQLSSNTLKPNRQDRLKQLEVELEELSKDIDDNSERHIILDAAAVISKMYHSQSIDSHSGGSITGGTQARKENRSSGLATSSRLVKESKAGSRKRVERQRSILHDYNSFVASLLNSYRVWKRCDGLEPGTLESFWDSLKHLVEKTVETRIEVQPFREKGPGGRYHIGAGLLLNLPFGHFESEINKSIPNTIDSTTELTPDLLIAMQQLEEYMKDATSWHDRSMQRGEIGDVARELWEREHGWNVNRPVWSCRTR